MSIRNYFLLLIIVAAVLSFDLPKGWHKGGADPDSYAMGIEPGVGPGNSKAATIQSNADIIKGYGTLMQSFKPGKYRGKKIRMTGYMKSEGVEKWAGFWLRIEGAPGEGVLESDNMQDRPVKWTTGWTKYELVLHVSADAQNISFGALLDGKGKIWFDNIKFEAIDEPTDKKGTVIYKDPQNLNFEE